MAQTLQGYVTAVQRLLHDANANFYPVSQLTDYINEARERVVRDTGALRTVQVSTAPLAPVVGGSTPVFWSANTAVTVGTYLVSNIYMYQVVGAGTTGSEAPPYPAGSANYPPSTPFLNGTATLQYAGPSEVINWVCLPQSLQTLDIININLYWGNTRIPLRYLPWTQFNAELRFWQNYIGRPIAFSVYGQSQIFISPVPDQVYTIEIDTIVLPEPLVNLYDVDTINDPFTTPVKFYAAYLAKYYEQSYGESEIYKQEYIKHIQSVLVAINTRRMPNPYSVTY
jgi:hypothetical protein